MSNYLETTSQEYLNMEYIQKFLLYVLLICILFSV